MTEVPFVIDVDYDVVASVGGGHGWGGSEEEGRSVDGAGMQAGRAALVLRAQEIVSVVC